MCRDVSKLVGLVVDVPAGFQGEVSIKFIEEAFSRNIHLCGAWITKKGANVPCVDEKAEFAFPGQSKQ